jgi:uncharacterized membrane protein
MGAKYYRDLARQKLTGNWKTAVIVGLIAWLLGGLLISASVGGEITINDKVYTVPSVQNWVLKLIPFSGLLSIIQFVIGGPVRLGYATHLLKQHDGEKTEINDLFCQFHRFGDGFCLYLLTILYVALWALLLIVPGIIAAFNYAMAPFIMSENENMTASEALRASKDLMKGHRWQLFCLIFSFIGWNLVSILTLGIGALFLNPYMNTAIAAFYREISGTNVQAVPQELPPAEFQ